MRDSDMNMSQELKLSIMIAVIGAIAVLISALIDIPVIFGQGVPTAVVTAPPPARFVYDVRVADSGSLNPIANSRLIIDVLGEEPLIATTDSKGLSVMIVESALVGKTGQLFVEAEGYDIYVQDVEIMACELPDLILLDAQP